MAGASVEVKGLAELQKQLAGLAKDGVKRVSKQVAVEAQRLIGAGFSGGHAPDGTPWEPIKHRPGQPLRDSGALGASVIAKDNGAGFTASSNLVYSRLQNQGGVVEVKKAKVLFSRKLGRAFGKSVKIPARQFLPGDTLPAAWFESFKEVVEDTIEALFP